MNIITLICWMIATGSFYVLIKDIIINCSIYPEVRFYYGVYLSGLTILFIGLGFYWL